MKEEHKVYRDAFDLGCFQACIHKFVDLKHFNAKNPMDAVKKNLRLEESGKGTISEISPPLHSLSLGILSSF